MRTANATGLVCQEEERGWSVKPCSTMNVAKRSGWKCLGGADVVSSDLWVRTTGPTHSDSSRLTLDLFHYYIPINDLGALLQVVTTVVVKKK